MNTDDDDSDPTLSGDYGNKHPHSRETRIKQRAKDKSQRDFGDETEWERYIDEATGELKL
jgi:hypothetical protein